MPTGGKSGGAGRGIPAEWQIPAVLRLRQALMGEKTRYWLLVTIAALATAPLISWTMVLLLQFFPALGVALSEELLPGWMMQFIAPLGLVSAGLGNMLSLGGFFAVPVLIVLWALANFNRQLKLATYDLVYGGLMLMLVDEQYTRLIEDERREHFRPAIIPVHPGEDFLSRLSYFASYYGVFRQLSVRPVDFKPPLASARNCWLEGSAACLGGCLNACAGMGACLTIPLLFRIVLTWSRQLAIKQAVLDYLGGRHEAALEQQYEGAPGES